MECKQSDSKKLYNVFDASKRNRRKKCGLDESNSDSDGSQSFGLAPRNSKHLLESELPMHPAGEKKKSSAGSSSGATPPTPARLKAPRTPRRLRKRGKAEISLALKSGFASTPRSDSPEQSPRTAPAHERAPEAAGAEQNFFIYDFLEEAIKKDKKRHKHHGRRHEEKRSPSAAGEEPREHHRHRRRARKERPAEDGGGVNQTALLETFIKIYSQFQGAAPKPEPETAAPIQIEATHAKSNKSLQCECKDNNSDIDQRPTRLRRDCDPPQHHCRTKQQSADKRSDSGSVGRGGQLPHSLNTTRCYDIGPRLARSGDYLKHYDDRRYFDDNGHDRAPRYDDRVPRYDDRVPRYDERPTRERNGYDRPLGDRFEERPSRDQYERRIHCDERECRRRKDRNWAGCREGEGRDGSVLSGAEAPDSLASVNVDSGFDLPQHLSASVGQKTRQKVCKQSVCVDPAIQQELGEQREALDKMIRLWQELMKRFKDVALNVDRSEKAVQESAATQVRLWRECMRRYETVARDVGETDARLADELKKQRAEMQQMGGVWRECLARYREVSAKLTTMKQQMSPEPPPPHLAAGAPPPAAPDGEGSPVPHAYRLQQPPPGYPLSYGGSPVRSRVSAPAAVPAPPDWCWGGPRGWAAGARPRSPARRRPSSPDSRSDESRGKRERRRRRRRDTERSGATDAHRRKERSTSKVNASRSDRKHRR